MKIVRVLSKNILGIELVEIAPRAGVTIVGGRNGAGKSSLINSIAFALGGKRLIPEEPIHDGENEAVVEVDVTGDDSLQIQPCTVRRTFVRRHDGSIASDLTITTKDGYLASEPQTLLNRICSQIGFDPLAFCEMPAKLQSETLLKLVGLDLTELDQMRADVFATRTEVGRQGKSAAAVLASKVKHADVPDDEIQVQDILSKLSTAESHNAAVDAAERELSELNHSRVIQQARVESIEGAISEMEASIEKLRANIADRKRELAAVVIDLSTDDQHLAAKRDAVAAMVRLNTDTIKQELVGAQVVNQKVRDNKLHDEAMKRVDELRVRWDELTAEIAGLDQDKVTQLTEAPWPVPGLGYEDGEVTFNGRPLGQASTAEQIRISLAICARLNPTLPFMFVQHGSLLDDDSLLDVATEGAKHGCQLFVERVGAGNECHVVIDEGRVVRIDDECSVNAGAAAT